MTVAELIATLALDFEDRASNKASKAAQALESSLKSINIEGAIKGDPFSNTYKYISAFRKQFRTLAQDISSGLDLGISGKKFLPGIKTLIKNIEDVHSHYAEVGVAFGNLNKLIDSSTSLYHKYGKVGVEENIKIQESLGEVASRMESVKATLSNVKLSPQLDKELRGRVIPSIDRMIEALKLGDDKSKTAFLKAVENLRKLNFGSKTALVGLQQLIREFDLLNKKTEQFYASRNIVATPVQQLGGAYSGILEKLGRTRAELSKTLGLIKSEFQYVPRMAESVRNQIISLAKAGYDLSATEVKNIKQIVQYRDIELQALQVRANVVRAGLASEQEAINLLKQTSLYAQKYNLSLKDVLNTLNLSTKDWASFYVESLKSKGSIEKIRSELDLVNILLKEAYSLGKTITAETVATLRQRKKELEIEAELIKFENKRVYSISQVVDYYDLLIQKSRASLGIDLDKSIKKAVSTLAEINVQLESQYNIESNISKLRKLIADSYAKDLEANRLIEAFGINREKIEQAITTAREQSIRSLQLQYELGLLNEQSQVRLRDELLQQANLTTEQQVLLGRINTQLSTEKSAYTLLVAEQEKLNNLLVAQEQYLKNLKVSGGSEEETKNAERVLRLIKERKQVVDETLAATKQLSDISDRTVRGVEKEVRSRIESKKILDSITKEKIEQLTTGIEELRTTAELRAREQQILNILKTTTKFVAANGTLTREWKNNTQKLERSLGVVRSILRQTETEAEKTRGTIIGAGSALSGFFNFRLVGVFLLYRTLWELRRIFSDVTKTIVELEDKMKKFQTITLATTEAVDLATDTVVDLSMRYALAATDIADALIKIGQAGYTAQESIALITSTSQLAVATGSELSDTVNLMLSAMQAWNLETSNAADVANIFTSAINSTRLTVDRLNTSFNYITGIAPQINVTLEETAAILGTMADAGIRASTSGTSMRAMFAELLRPSNRLIDTLSNLGLTIEDVDPQLHTITQILNTLKKAGFSAADAFRAFGRRGASGIAVLVSNAEKVAQLSTSFNNYARAASLAAIASESLQARLTIFWNSIKAVFVDLVPTITHFIDALTGLRKMEITPEGAIKFTKTVGEIVLAAESAKKRIDELSLSMSNFNDTVAEIRGLERAGLFIQAVTKAYKAGLVPLEEYNKLMKEYNAEIVTGADTTNTLRKAQELLNDSIKRNIEIERVRRIVEFSDALEKQAEANRKLRDTYEEQNKELIQILKSYKNYRDELATPFTEADVVLGLPDVGDLNKAISNIQKLLGSPLSSEWLKSLRDQNVELTGITKDMSKQLYDFIKVVELAGPEFAKKLYSSNKTINDYTKSLKNFLNILKYEGGSIKDLTFIDTKNIKELAKYPKLFVELSTQFVSTSEDIDALKVAFSTLIDEGILPATEGGAVQRFVSLLEDEDIQIKSLVTSINVLQKQFSDMDTTLSRTTVNFKNTMKPLQDVQTLTLQYSHTLQKLNLIREQVAWGIVDYTKKLNELTNVQKIQINQQKALQAKQTYLVDIGSITARMQLMEQSYKRQLELAKGNAETINKINAWRAEQETRLYSEMSKAATNYKNTIDQLVKDETSALQKLYQQLNDINVQLQQNEVSLELSLKSFDNAVREKLRKMEGTSRSTFDRLKREARSISSLLSEARLYADEGKGKVYLREAEQRLNALKSSFLSTTKLSEAQVRSLSHRIKALMKDLSDVKDSVLEDQKTTLEAQINMMEKSLNSLVTEMRSAMDAVKKSLEKQGQLEIKDNIDTEIVPKFEALIKKIVESEPKLVIKDNLDSVITKLKDVSKLLDDINRKAKISIAVSKGEGKSTGGWIPGYGGGDVVPTWLEPGEFVVRKEIVKNLGLGFFKSINEGLVFNASFPKMQAGGVVQESKPKEIVNVNLNLGGTQFPLFGDKEIVDMFVERLEKERLMSI